MDVHPRALARRAAIGRAGECLLGFDNAARAPVRRPTDLEVHRHETTSKNSPGTGFANFTSGIVNRRPNVPAADDAKVLN